MDNYQKSLKVVNRLVRKSIYENATKVAIYKNLEDSEINTSFILYNHLISEGKEVVWIDGAEFDAKGVDLTIIPITNFDENGNFISRIKVNNFKKLIGFAYDENYSDGVISYNKAMILTPQRGYNV